MSFIGVPDTASPGFTTLIENLEVDLFWGDVQYNQQYFRRLLLPSSLTDLNTVDKPVTTLRPGLLLGTLTGTNTIGVYTALETNGLETASLILVQEVNMLDPRTGIAAAQLAVCTIGGNIKFGALVRGDADPGAAPGAAERTDLSPEFKFDDHWES